MKKSVLNENLLHFLKLNFPEEAVRVDQITTHLLLDRKAAYRRIRGETCFTLDEAGILSSKMGISLDNISRIPASIEESPIYMQAITPPNPGPKQIKDNFILLRDALKNIATYNYSEYGSACNSLNTVLLMGYTRLVRFYYFKSIHQLNMEATYKHYEDLPLRMDISSIMNEIVDYSSEIKNVSIIWDMRVIENLIHDIEFFRDGGFIETESILELKKEILSFLDKIERLTISGTNEHNNVFSLYLCKSHINANYYYIYSPELYYGSLTLFYMSSLKAYNKHTYMRVQEWVNSFKKMSTLISRSGAIERNVFFKKQRDLINMLL